MITESLRFQIIGPRTCAIRPRWRRGGSFSSSVPLRSTEAWPEVSHGPYGMSRGENCPNPCTLAQNVRIPAGDEPNPNACLRAHRGYVGNCAGAGRSADDYG